MTTSGWLVMILSVGGVTVFFAVCTYWALVLKEHKHSDDEPEDENLDAESSADSGSTPDDGNGTR
jgi:hypothetical protein